MSDTPSVPGEGWLSTLPLTTQEINRLADYNAEVSRGLVHTDEYKQKMAVLQRTFNAHG